MRYSHLNAALVGKEASVDIKSKLRNAEKMLKECERVSPLSSKNWRLHIPKESGVYVIWEGNTPVYVGETSSLYKRMSDLSRPINHTFSRKIADKFDIDKSDLERLAEEVSSRYKLSCITVDFGRAEIEEYLILRWRQTLINKPTKRLQSSDQYSWVIPN